MKKIKRIILICFLSLLTYGSSILNVYGANADIEEKIKGIFAQGNDEYCLYISKTNFMLYVYSKDLKILNSYKIAYGINHDKKAKLYALDGRTPEGIYKITEILSLNADKNTIAYKKLKDMNTVYFRAKDGHFKYGKINEDLGTNAYGPRFFRINYPNQDDILRYNDALKKGLIPKLKNGKFQSAGGGIAIHGNCDEASIGHLSSSGCIRMYNDDIVALDKYVKLDLQVIISSD